jgi:integron integrase
MTDDSAALAPRLLDALRQQVRYMHYSLRTEEAYVHWVRAFVRFHGLRHPADMSHEAFLTWLATERQVAPSTHKQALLLLYQKVLRQDIPWMAEIGRLRTEKRLPVVLTQGEVARVLAALDALPQHPQQQQQQQQPSVAPLGLVGRLLYGTGMRLLEGLLLRVKNIDLERRAIVVREGKGAKDCVVMLPASLERPLRDQLALLQALWRTDRARGLGGVHLPHALARKYSRAAESFAWFWVSPQAEPSIDPRGSGLHRHYLFDQTFQRAFKRALAAARLARPATPHTLRQSFATHLCRPVTTSAPCRICWVIRSSAPP